MMIGHDQQMTPIDLGVNEKGQGHIDLIRKNLTTHGLLALKLGRFIDLGQ
jgi:hypothetical protein